MPSTMQIQGGGSAYAASGVGACQCRHMLVRPNGVGDLQKGEKYVAGMFPCAGNESPH